MNPITFVLIERLKETVWTTIAKPFSLEIWILIGISVLIYGLILSSIINFEQHLIGSRRRWSLSKTFWYLFTTITFQGADLNNLKRLPSRLSVGLWLLSLLVLGYSYSGTLISFLTPPVYDTAPTTFGELASAVQNEKWSCGSSENSKFVIFKGVNSGVTKILMDHIDSNNNWINPEEIIKRIRSDRFAFIDASNIVNKKIIPELKGRILKSTDSLMTFSEAYYLRKDFPYKDDLNKMYVRRMFESGVTENIEKKTFRKRDNDDNEITPLDTTQLSGCFFLLVVGYSIAFICLVGERLIAVGARK
ncbi:glutamate receptor ionotropic, delta-2-like [Centruroides vittatus]|uniref:glutamate receptor ionotropic, delta-2-like n=2 Tax=Centruroides vittatus TaxID=120091 RepID=UPI00350F70E3